MHSNGATDGDRTRSATLGRLRAARTLQSRDTQSERRVTIPRPRRWQRRALPAELRSHVITRADDKARIRITAATVPYRSLFEIWVGVEPTYRALQALA